MQNVEKHRTVRLFTSWNNDGFKKRGASSAVASGFLKKLIIFDENLIGCEMQKQTVTLNKPIQIGCIILEHSKIQMYQFHYDILKPMYPASKLLYMDTDSFIYDINTQDFYKDLKALAENNTPYFDTSNFAQNNQFGIPQINHQKLGTMKDELKGKLMRRYCALSPKCYIYETQEEETSIRAKGVQRRVACNLTFEDYDSCLNDPTIKIMKEQKIFRSHLHTVFTEVMTKIALSGQDSKRFILDDCVNTLAWGHYRVLQTLNEQPVTNTL